MKNGHEAKMVRGYVWWIQVQWQTDVMDTSSMAEEIKEETTVEKVPQQEQKTLWTWTPKKMVGDVWWTYKEKEQLISTQCQKKKEQWQAAEEGEKISEKVEQEEGVHAFHMVMVGPVSFMYLIFRDTALWLYRAR